MASTALLRYELGDQTASKAAGAESRVQADPGFSLIQSSKVALRIRLYAALGGVDLASIFLGFATANLLRFGEMHAQSVDLLVILLPVFLGMAISRRAYSVEALEQPKTGTARALRALAFALVAVIGTIFYLKVSADYSRIVMGVGTVASLLYLCGGRWLFGQAVGRRYNWCFTNELLFVDEVPVMPTRGEIVVFADKAQLSPTTDDPMQLDRLGRLLNNCDRVILACPPHRRAAWSAMLKGGNVNVELLAPELDELGALAMSRCGDLSTVLISHRPLGLRDRMAKRSLDLALTIPALILLLPAFAAIAIAIKLDSPGPVFFRQERTGLGNRIFHMFKFRSMQTGMTDREGATSTRRGDARITRVGKFLRRTSLDELPQLINVLLGDMSIVGPRPHALASTAEDVLFWNIDPRYLERHVIQPGITGLAQVRGFRGSTFQRSDLSNRLQADLEYLTGWSIWRDIGIMLATVKVLKHKNAF